MPTENWLQLNLCSLDEEIVKAHQEELLELNQMKKMILKAVKEFQLISYNCRNTNQTKYFQRAGDGESPVIPFV